MGRVRLNRLTLPDVTHKFPSGRMYFFRRGEFTEVNSEEDLAHARKNPQRYDVEDAVDKAKGLLDKVREKIAPSNPDLPESELVGARGQGAWKEDTLKKMNRAEQEWIVRNVYPDYTGDIPRRETGRIALILELQNLVAGDEIPAERLEEIRKM